MSTLIVYGSTHGFTEMCAQRLAQQLPFDVDTVDLSTHPHPKLASYGVIAVGGSIHLGAIQPIVGEFCERERDALLRHPLALFLSCMKRDEEAAQQFDNAFPCDCALTRSPERTSEVRSISTVCRSSNAGLFARSRTSTRLGRTSTKPR